MVNVLSSALAAALLCTLLIPVAGQYYPTWPSIDSRPLPSWYDEAKIGIFIHWGVFSVPSFGPSPAWFWWNWQGAKLEEFVKFMADHFKPNITYPDFAPHFTAELYDPEQWADIFSASGAKYVVLTSKHHEGYTLWPSKVSWNWNAKDVGPKRDLLGDLAKAIRSKTDIHFGVYHSMFEWFNPLYLTDKNNSWQTQYFVNAKTLPELVDLVMTYEPDVIWSDGDWEAPDTYWKSTDFLSWLYNESFSSTSPVKEKVVVNDRWGSGISCHHGGYYTCSDKFNPKTLQHHKWENAMTLDKNAWGYRRNMQLSDLLTIEELITTLAETVSCGGNILMNIGPTHDGRIIPMFEERLRQLGSWLSINGEAIYGSTPWTYQNDTVTPGVWYTSKMSSGETTVYAIVLSWPKDNSLLLGALDLKQGAKIYMLGVKNPLSWIETGLGETLVIFPSLNPYVVPSQWAWVLKVSEDSLYSTEDNIP